MRAITERLANLSIPTVIITIVVLLALRWIMLRQKTPVAKQIAEIAESLAVAMGLVFLIIRPFIVQAFFIPSASMRPTLLEDDHILVNKFIYRFREPKLGDVVVFKAPPEADHTDGVEKDFIKRVIAVPGDTVRITAGHVLVGETQYTHQDLKNALSLGKGDMVKLQDGQILVNGKPYSKEEIASAVGYPEAPVRVVPGKVILNGKTIREDYTAEDPDDSYPGPSNFVKDSWVVIDKDGNEAVKIPKGRLLVMGDNRNDSNDARKWGLLERKRVLGKAMFIFWPLYRIRWVH